MPEYVALSIVAPNGTNIASGMKSIEVRSWRPEELPLHNLLIVENDRFLTKLGESDPHGRAVALVDVLQVQPWEPSDVLAACASKWSPGYSAWLLSNVRPVNCSSPVTASRGLYRVQVEISSLDSRGQKRLTSRSSGSPAAPADLKR